jgi:tetratricopeptide (TPR) repeat protein
LLQAGADPYLLNSKGQNALYVAARLGRKDIVDVFITSGIDVNVQTASGMTILHIAASNGFSDLVKQVVSVSPELLNHKTNFQKTALHFAVAKGHVEVVNYLLGLPNIKADTQNEKGFSALHYAVVNNYLPIVKMLVEHGVNTGLLTSRYQYTALNLSIERNYLDIVQYLKSVNAIENNSAVTYADRNKAIKVYEQAAPYYNRDEYDQGLVFIKQALEYDPSYAVAYHGLAVMYLYYAVDYQKAEAAIVKSLELDGSDVEAYYTAGRVYYALGDIDKSKPFFQEYVKLAPDTYNTQDLKKSYTYLLTNSTGLPSIAGSSLLNEGLFYFDKYRLHVTGILLVFLLLFLVVRRRNTSDSL